MATFLETVTPKIGVHQAADLARDARISVLEKVLLQKGLISQEELNALQETERQAIDTAISRLQINQ